MGNNLKIMGNTFSNVSSITAHDATSGTHKYYDTSTVNATAGDVKSGKKIINSSGTEITGTLANYNGNISLSPTETISSLANTTWLFKYNLDFSTTYQWSINFISNNNTYTGLACVLTWQELWYYSTGSSPLYLEGNWNSGNNYLYQKIKIIDGTDISSSTLINWLSANAILIKDEDSNITVRYGNAALGELTEDSTLTLSTNGKISTNNITITYTKPSGGGGSGANLYQFHFDIQRTGAGDPSPVLASTEKLSDYGLTPSDFLVTNTHHVAAWVDMNSGPYIIDYSDSNDDDSYSATAQSITGSMVDKTFVNNYGDADDYNSVDLFLECVATKNNGNPFWFNFEFNTYYMGDYCDVFMPCVDWQYGFDVTNYDTYSGAGRKSYSTWIHKQSGNLVFTLNVLIFDEVSS